MTAKLAKSTLAQWAAEGLSPSVDDIIALNDLALKIERASDATDWACAPRCAFLGDVILWEPTIAKMMWLDRARQIMTSDADTQNTLLAYTLATPAAELPTLHDVKILTKAVQKFRDEVLIFYTSSQIVAAIDIVLSSGREPEIDERDDEHRKAATPPADLMSYARRLLGLAALNEVPVNPADYTIAALESLVVRAICAKGQDISKDLRNSAYGDYLVAAGRMHARLAAARDEAKKKGEANGEGEH